MNKKTDTSKIKILQLIAMVGEISADKICEFFNSKSYTKKQITILKKEAFIKKADNGIESVLRLTTKAKKHLKKYLPEEYGDMIIGPKAINQLKGEKKRIARRNKLIEILQMLHQADVKIFFDEKTICKKLNWIKGTDNTDDTDLTDRIKDNCEFYTSIEVRYFVPEYKTSTGSRCLGILIARDQVLTLYSVGDNMIWKQEREENFQITTSEVITKKLFGRNAKTSMLFFGNIQNAVTIMGRFRDDKGGKIQPTYKLPNMLFANKDQNMDYSLNLIVNHKGLIDELESKSMDGITYDERVPDFNGVVEASDETIFFLFAFKFNLYKVAKAVQYSIEGRHSVKIVCFGYQKPILELFLKGKDHNTKILTISHEKYLDEVIDNGKIKNS